MGLMKDPEGCNFKPCTVNGVVVKGCYRPQLTVDHPGLRFMAPGVSVPPQ